MAEKHEIIGVAHIYTSFNNTIIHLTDLTGKTIARFSGGQLTKQDRLKANPTISMFVAKKAAEIAKDIGITGLYVKVKAQTNMTGPGPGAHAAVRALGKEGFKILSIIDVTKVPRGGPKKKGGRRGRRV
jgi:small subunit ribosomal protein S11